MSATEVDEPPSPKSTALLLALLIVPSALVYAQVLDFGILNYDDEMYLFNPVVQDWWGQPWETRLLTPSLGYPLAFPTALHAFTGWLFDGSTSALHALNLAFHLVNVVLVFFLVDRLVEDRMAAFAGTALWAFHPVLAEPVSWLASLKDVTMTAGLVGSLLAFDVWRRAESRKMSAVTIALGVLASAVAFGSKPTAVVLGLLLATMVLWRPDHLMRRKRGGLVIAAMLLLAGLALTASAFSSHADFGGQQGGFELGRIGAAATLQMQNYVVPLSFSTVYRPEPPEAAWVVAPLVFLIACASAWLVRRRHPTLLVGLAWIAITWAPVSNVIWLNRFTADSYMYLTSVGVAIFAAALVARGDIWSKKPAVAALLGVLLGLLLLTYHQTSTWKDSGTLWTHAMIRYPDDSFVRMKIGQSAYDRGALEVAIEVFESIPRDAYTQIGVPFRWGIAHCRLGDNVRCAELLAWGLTNQKPDGNVQERYDHGMWLAMTAGARKEFDLPVDPFTPVQLEALRTVRPLNPP